MAKAPFFSSTEHVPGTYAVEFVTDAMFLVPVDQHPEDEKGKHEVRDGSIAGLRARRLAEDFVRFWDGK